eukprot:11165790-Heterocapsa_arctica.AAC.1
MSMMSAHFSHEPAMLPALTYQASAIDARSSTVMCFQSIRFPRCKPAGRPASRQRRLDQHSASK